MPCSCALARRVYLLSLLCQLRQLAGCALACLEEEGRGQRVERDGGQGGRVSENTRHGQHELAPLASALPLFGQDERWPVRVEEAHELGLQRRCAIQLSSIRYYSMICM